MAWSRNGQTVLVVTMVCVLLCYTITYTRTPSIGLPNYGKLFYNIGQSNPGAPNAYKWSSRSEQDSPTRTIPSKSNAASIHERGRVAEAKIGDITMQDLHSENPIVEKSDVNGTWESDVNATQESYVNGMRHSDVKLARSFNVHQRRFQHFREQCKTFQSEATQLKKTENSTMRLYYLDKYNLTAQTVAKIGSTFMYQLFTVLIQASQHLVSFKSLFSISRMNVHTSGMLDRYMAPFSADNITGVGRTLLFTRNPYTRLFSAFVDKVYILNAAQLARVITNSKHGDGNNTTRKCLLNVTFSDFLTYILRSRNPPLNSHYFPTSDNIDLSVMCRARSITIVKQETFTSDIEHVLGQYNLTRRTVRMIRSALHGDRASTTIKGIVKTSYYKYKTGIVRKDSCLTWHSLAYRLWTSFQMQGFVHEGSLFPEDQFVSVELLSSPAHFTKVILAAIEARPVTPEQSLYQRRKYLVQAYSGVSQADIRLIKRQYYRDFKLFEYGMDVPTTVV